MAPTTAFTTTAADADTIPGGTGDDGLLRRRLAVLLKVIQRDFGGQARPLALANLMADRYRWPRLRTLADLRTLKTRGLLDA